MSSESFDRFKDFKAELGSNRQAQEQITTRDEESYTDVELLRDNILRLRSFLDVFESELEDELKNFALPVGSFDTRLVDSHRQEWGDSSVPLPSQVSFLQYKNIKGRNTIAAKYIKKQWEKAARDLLGTSSLEILSIIGIVKKESSLIVDFLDNTFDEAALPSTRVVEQFNDWVVSAFNSVQKIRGYLSTRRPDFSMFQPELDRAEATKIQGQLKAKMNAVNSSLERDEQSLRRYFSDTSDVFYKKFLGKAYTVQAKANRSTNNRDAQKEVSRAVDFLSEDMRSVIGDQERRKTLFKKKIDSIAHDIQVRDTYAAVISGLAVSGKELPTSGPGILVPSEESPEEVVHTISQLSADDGGSNMVSSHNRLKGRFEPDAHPQYLLKAGGLITGDLVLEEGIRVDGIIPSLHTHTGDDGSRRLDGTQVEKGTFHDQVIDLDNKPPVPENIHIAQHKAAVIPPGQAVIDTQIAWEGFNRYTYEVQLTPIHPPIPFNHGYLWIVAQDTEDDKYYIYQVDAEDGTVVEAFLSPTQTPFGLDFIVVNDEPQLWITDKQNADIYLVNAESGIIGAITDVSHVTSAPTGISKETGALWLASEDGIIYKLDDNYQIIKEFS